MVVGVVGQVGAADSAAAVDSLPVFDRGRSVVKFLGPGVVRFDGQPAVEGVPQPELERVERRIAVGFIHTGARSIQQWKRQQRNELRNGAACQSSDERNQSTGRRLVRILHLNVSRIGLAVARDVLAEPGGARGRRNRLDILERIVAIAQIVPVRRGPARRDQPLAVAAEGFLEEHVGLARDFQTWFSSWRVNSAFDPP